MQDRTSFLRHAVLGAANGLKLSAAALQIKMPVPDQAAFLEDLLASADTLIELLDQYEAIPPVTAK